MKLTPKVIESCVKKIKSENNIGGIAIPEESVAHTFWEKVKSFEEREGEISRQLIFIENTKVKLLKAKFDVEEAYGKTLKHIII